VRCGYRVRESLHLRALVISDSKGEFVCYMTPTRYLGMSDVEFTRFMEAKL